jgi:hypothetical protein
MTDRTADDIDTLKAHIRKHLAMLAELHQELQAALSRDVPLIGRTARSAMLVAGLLENYYTCSETIFVRISRFFENNIQPERWHKELLSRMTLEYPDIRPRIISDRTEYNLAELMRFRHFKRYYFGTAYDWTRIDELVIRLETVHTDLVSELGAFLVWLDQMDSADPSSRA